MLRIHRYDNMCRTGMVCDPPPPPLPPPCVCPSLMLLLCPDLIGTHVAHERAAQEGAVGETTRSVIGGFVARLLESIKSSAAAAAEGAKSAAVNKV